ncbi:putative adenylyl-sulfate kinase [Helianthus anomalus]
MLLYEFLGELEKLFSNAGVICIAGMISPYRKDRDACRSILPEGDFNEVDFIPKGFKLFLIIFAFL